MKKSITLLIGVTFLVTILLVGLFGSTIFANPDLIVQKVTAVTISNSDVSVEKRKILVMSGQPKITYQINWNVLPEDATQKEVDFLTTVDPTKADRVHVNLAGLVTFYGKVTATITIQSKDGTNKSDYITFIVLS